MRLKQRQMRRATMVPISIEQSGAFVEKFSLPPTDDGPLHGLSFAVKDLIDVAGHRTGCGNPTWAATHPPASVSAVCVDQLLEAGARCEGKTITDEVAFSLLGENHFYGTPLNPAAPSRVPGGSSSGSASAVACGIVDFALGTDTGGSVRVPASNCGLWGLRPTHGVASVAGVMPFAPTFDTVGLLARDTGILMQAATVLLGIKKGSVSSTGTIYAIAEAFDAVDCEAQTSLDAAIQIIEQQCSFSVRKVSLRELCGESFAGDLSIWRETFAIIRWAEVASSLGTWISEAKPVLGLDTAEAIKQANNLDRRCLNAANARREKLCARLHRALAGGNLLCLPTVPSIAPIKGSRIARTSSYYQRLLALTSIAGIGRLPQLTMPLATSGGAPIGLSIIGAPYDDVRLIEIAQFVMGE